MVRNLFKMTLIRRFFTSIQEEGFIQAVRKTRIYIGIRLRGLAPSVLDNTGQGPIQTEHMYLNGIWQSLAQQEAFHVTSPPAYSSKQRRIALIGDLNLPQCRKYRVEQLADFWRGQGVALDYVHYQDVPRAVSLLQRATHVMEYRLQTSALTAMYRYEARRLRLPILYDLDDPLFSVPAYETYQNMEALAPELKSHFLSEAPKYLEMMNGADIITVSTPGMAAHTQFLSPRPVYVRRNFADIATLETGAVAHAKRPKQDGLFRVVFASGSHGHEVDFGLIQKQISGFLAAAENRRLMIIGHFDITRLPADVRDKVELHPFSTYDRYLATLAQADCAVMPLQDDLFNRCKSAVRVIDAAAVSLPSVVGQVGDLAQMIQHGKTGMIVHTPDGWRTALEGMAQNPQETVAMGLAARHDLKVNWNGTSAKHIIDPNVLDWVLK